MSVIWKFLVPIGERVIMPAPVPGGGTIRHCNADPATGAPALWIECEPGLATVEREFFAIGTGGNVPSGCKYLGTCVCGPYVWHVFERG